MSNVVDDKKKPFKAVASAVIAGLTAAGYALSDKHIDTSEGVGIALAAVIAGAAVYGIKNPKVVAPE